MKVFDIDYDIPGMMNVVDLNIIANVTSLVPENGHILEIGCYLGRTSNAICAAKHPSTKFSIIDPFGFGTPIKHPGYDGSVTNWQKAQEIYSQSKKIKTVFDYFMKDKEGQFQTIVDSSLTYKFTDSYDFVFIDGDHSYSSVVSDINNFISNEDTLIGGDDYTDLNYRVKEAVNSFSDRRRLYVSKLNRSKTWFLIPNQGYWTYSFNEIEKLVKYYSTLDLIERTG